MDSLMENIVWQINFLKGNFMLYNPTIHHHNVPNSFSWKYKISISWYILVLDKKQTDEQTLCGGMRRGNWTQLSSQIGIINHQ